MIVTTYELGDLANGGFKKSKLAEESLLKLVAGKKKLSYSVDLTEGKNTDWDGMLGTDPVEIKFSAKMFTGENRFGNFFETHYKSGKPSALLLSKATKYITVSPGWSNKYASVTGKVRMWNVNELLNVMDNPYPIVEFDYGEKGFFVPNKSPLIQHEWVGDVSFNVDKCSYDISRWI